MVESSNTNQYSLFLFNQNPKYKQTPQSNLVLLFKRLIYGIEKKLETADYRIVVGANPTRWKPWNRSLCPLHLIYKKRYVIYNVTIMNIIPFSVPVWRLALYFLYTLAKKRHPKILFIGNQFMRPLSPLILQKFHEEFHMFYLRILDHWIPGLLSNMPSMFLPFKPKQKVTQRNYKGVSIRNVAKIRGQKYIKPLGYESYRFFNNYFLPECFILLSSSNYAYNADIELYRKSIPALALTSTDTKNFGFSGCFYSLPAGVNYEDHLHFYIFLFYLVIAYSRARFFHEEFVKLNPVFYIRRKKLDANIIVDIQTVKSKTIFISKLFYEKFNTFHKKVQQIFYDQELHWYLTKTEKLRSDQLLKILNKGKSWFLEEREITIKQIKDKEEQLLLTNFVEKFKKVQAEDPSLPQKSRVQKVADKLDKILSRVMNVFRHIISLTTLQQLYFGGGVTFLSRSYSPKHAQQKIFFFLTNPGIRILRRLLSSINQPFIVQNQKEEAKSRALRDFTNFNPRLIIKNRTLSLFGRIITFSKVLPTYKTQLLQKLKISRIPLSKHLVYKFNKFPRIYLNKQKVKVQCQTQKVSPKFGIGLTGTRLLCAFGLSRIRFKFVKEKEKKKKPKIKSKEQLWFKWMVNYRLFCLQTHKLKKQWRLQLSKQNKLKHLGFLQFIKSRVAKLFTLRKRLTKFQLKRLYKRLAQRNIIDFKKEKRHFIKLYHMNINRKKNKKN
jgi:hypothetical protein